MKHKIFAGVAFVALLASGVFASVYSAGSTVPCMTNQAVTVWSAETPTPGNGTSAASQQVLLNNSSVGKNGTPFSVDGKFSGAPGGFEVDVQVAATDTDVNYQTCSGCNIITVDATNNTFHLDYSGTARFARLLMRTRTNAVSVTATFTGG